MEAVGLAHMRSGFQPTGVGEEVGVPAASTTLEAGPAPLHLGSESRSLASPAN